MAYKNLIYKKEGRVAWVTLNRPEKLNAMSVGLLKELNDALLEKADKDPEVRVIVLKGAGRAFCAGYDIGEAELTDVAAGIPITDDRQYLQEAQERWWQIRQLRKPTIAQVHGYCLAGGTQLAMSCDIILVAENAQIGNVQAGPMGAGMLGGEWAWEVGARKAKELFFVLGERIEGKEAARIGWANRAVPEAMLEEEVRKLAAKIARTPLEILTLEKMAINRVSELMGLRLSMMQNVEIDNIAHYSPPVQRFLSAIKEKGLKRAMEEWQEEAPR